MTTLASLRGRIEQILIDVDNSIWTQDVLDEGIRQALAEYSKVNPREVITTLTFSSSTRELDTSSISGLLDVERVWTPYTSSSPEFPPNWRNFEYWVDSQLLYFPDGTEPSSDDVARIFYRAMQTIKGLDAETTTTLPTDDETLLCIGGAGHAATARAVDLIEQVTQHKLVPANLRAWGLGKLQEFRAGLKTVARQRALRGSAFVGLPRLDRWEGEWS